MRGGRLRAALLVTTVLAAVNGAPTPARADAGAESTPASVTGIPCYPDAGPRVHVFYLYAEGQPDDVEAERTAIRDAAAQTDAVFAASAQRTGGERHVRFLMSPDCALVVTSVAVPSASVAANLAQVSKAGLLAQGEVGLAFAGPTLGGFTGDATRVADDRPGAVNSSNAGGRLAEVGAAYWGSVEGPASMLARVLGAVQLTAPHASATGGCNDGFDPLCYDDLAIGSPVTLSCGPTGRYLLDCNGDDYFSTAPAAGSWLASHWNIADSVFLASAAPPRTDPVETMSLTVDGVPADGRVGPQTPLTVTVVDSQPLDRVVLVSDRSPGVQPLTLTGSAATGSLHSLASAGPGVLFAIATDKLGRQRASALLHVTYVRGAVLTLGSPSQALRGTVPYTVDLDLSGDQVKTTRFVVFRQKTDTSPAVVLADRSYVSGTSQYTGDIDTRLVPDGDAQPIVLVLADASGTAIPGSATALRRTVSNSRPALSLGVAPDQVLSAGQLTATTTEPVTAVRFAQTTTDCAAGRTIGQATSTPYSVAYDPAVDWKGPDQPWSLCATATLPDGSTTTVGPTSVTTTEPDSVELRLTPGKQLTVGLNRIPIVVHAPSHRAVRAVQLLETTTVFGRGGHLVVSQPIADGAIPATVDFVGPPGARGTTELYVRVVFQDGTGEYIRSNAVAVTAVQGPAPTATASARTIVAGGKVLISGTALPGSQLRMYAVSRPSTTYRLVRSGLVPADGRYSALLAPTTNTRVYVETVGGRAAASLPVEVRSVVTFAVTRTATRTYTFSGTASPKRAGMTVTVARLTATGAGGLVRARTGADGRWKAAFRFPVGGTFELLAVAAADSVNAQGISPARRITVS